MSIKYKEAGVDLEAGYESVRLIKSHVARTKVKGAVDSIGAFGGMFDLSMLNMKEPVLVSAIKELNQTIIDVDMLKSIKDNILTKEESFPMGNRKSYYKVKGILAVAMI